MMLKGVMFIEIKDDTDPITPVRTGRRWVLADESAKALGADPVEERVCWISESDAHRVGLTDDKWRIKDDSVV
jgi:hypothetical protein